MMALQRIGDFRSVLESQLVYAWRRHLDALLERTATEVAEARSARANPRALPLVRTVGFADLTSSTEYLVQLGAAELASFVQRFESIARDRSEEHTSELQSRGHLVCRLLPEKKKA